MTRTTFTYKNHRGDIAERTIEVTSLDYCPIPNNHYGYGPGWFLTGFDFTGERKGEEVRSFALCNIQMPEELFKFMTNNKPFRIDLTSPEIKAQIANAKLAEAVIHHMEQGEFGEGVNLTATPPERQESNEHAADSLAYAMTALPVDEPTGGEAQGLVITGRLRNAQKGPYFPGGADCLSGESFGHVKFPDGMPIHTSVIVEDLGPTRKGGHLFKTKSGSIYLVESWAIVRVAPHSEEFKAAVKPK